MVVGISTWLRYLASKFDYSVSLGKKIYVQGQGHVPDSEILDIIWKNLFLGRLTFLHCSKAEETASMGGTLCGTLLVRKIPYPDPRRVHVGDVVVLKDPMKSDSYLVRRLAAVEGYEMVSDDLKDKAFILEKDECWVLADNKKLKPKEAYDSRSFGPVTMAYIVGRAIYCLRSAVDHGPIQNSPVSNKLDSAVLEVELDVDDMAKNHKA